MGEQNKRILDAARDIYLEEGLQGLSMRKIAARVGVTATALYRHFGNKEAIVAEMLEEGFRIFAAYLNRALEEKSPEARMTAAGRCYAEFAIEQPKYYETIFIAPTEFWAKTLPESHVEGFSNTSQYLIQRVKECMDGGYFRPGDPADTAMTIWAHSHGLASLYVTGRIEKSPAEFKEMFLQSGQRLTEGLRETVK
jgi:AcrR family transcriptional regulator